MWFLQEAENVLCVYFWNVYPHHMEVCAVGRCIRIKCGRGRCHQYPQVYLQLWLKRKLWVNRLWSSCWCSVWQCRRGAEGTSVRSCSCTLCIFTLFGTGTAWDGLRDSKMHFRRGKGSPYNEEFNWNKCGEKIYFFACQISCHFQANPFSSLQYSHWSSLEKERKRSLIC